MRVSTLALLVGVFLFTSTPAFGQSYQARLSGSAEVLPVTTTGQGVIDLNLNGTTLTVSGSFAGLASDFNAGVGMHIHVGRAGSNGGVMFPLTPVLAADRRGGTLAAPTNTFTLTANQVTDVQEGRAYVNVHTMAHGGGEIRGQVLRAGTETFLAVLGGSNELPANTSTAQGAVVAELDGTSLRVTGSFSGLTSPVATSVAGGAHLHIGGAGANGPVAFPLAMTLAGDGLSATIDASANTFTLTTEQVAAVRARRMYANVHTARYMGGEIRGQLAGNGMLHLTALLSGSQEVPTVTTTAMGNTLLELDGDTLYASGGFSGLSSELNTAIAGGAHLHMGMAGSNGPVIFPLATTASGDGLKGTFDHGMSNRFVLSSDQKAALLARGLYVNVHSMTHASSDVRGQVVPPHVAVFVAPLLGMNENPAVGTTALGNVVLELDATNRVVATGGFKGLSTPLNTALAGGAHLHTGAAGVNGPVVFPLATTSTNADLDGVFAFDASNTFTLSAEHVAAVQGRGFYVNVHSTAAASGEIRGQVVPAASALLRANLSGTAEVSPVVTTGRGTLVGEIVGDSLFVSGAWTSLSSDFNGGAHLHGGDVGENGGVVFSLSPIVAPDKRSGGGFLVSDNRFGLTADQKAGLMERGFYANVHTVGHPSGEIRGQMIPYADAVLEATLGGENETSVVLTPATGGVIAILTDTSAIVAGGFSGLTSALNTAIAGGAHLHGGAAGANGPVVFSLGTDVATGGLSGTFAAAQNVFAISAEQRAALLTGGFYANIHSLTNASGEIRGQLLASANVAPPMAAIDSPTDGTRLTLQGGASTVFRATWMPVNDANANPVVYRWQLSATSDFAAPLVDARVDETAFETTFGALDVLLAGAGVAAGTETTLYHRVLASDGSRQAVGEASTVLVTRGTLVAADENVLPQSFALRGVVPNPARTQVTLRLDLDAVADLDVRVYDVLGREVARFRQTGVAPGTNRSLALNLGAVASGTYVYRLTATRAAGTVSDTGTLTLVR